MDEDDQGSSDNYGEEDDEEADQNISKARKVNNGRGIQETGVRTTGVLFELLC
jgi:hypothetical protein